MRRRQTLYDHAWEIRKAHGYRVYEDREAGRKFRTFLHGRAWIHAEGPVALFDHAVGRLRRHRVLLPGVRVLARQVSEVRADILGYRFSPRFADLADQRLWCADLPEGPRGTYGPLEAPARNRINTKKITTWWPDMLRVAGSLITNQVRAYDLLRMFGRDGRPPRSGRRSPSTAGSPRLCTCWR